MSLVCSTEVSSHQIMRTFFFLLRKGHRLFEVLVACFNEAVHNLQTNACYMSCDQKNSSNRSRSVNNACIKYCLKKTHTSSKSVFVDFAIDCTFPRMSVSNSSRLIASSCKADIRTSTHSPFKLWCSLAKPVFAFRTPDLLFLSTNRPTNKMPYLLRL